MFTVRCPASLVWHPSVHHSLLLLRALQQRHTLVLEAEAQSPPLPQLLGQYATRLHISREATDVGSTDGLRVVHHPEHLLHFFCGACSSADAATRARMEAELPRYLETSVVMSHVLSTVDALLVALQTEEMETTRRTHVALMDLVERLDRTLQDTADIHSSGADASAGAEEPLSTWPLYASLQFLIAEGGLLTSAFPRVQRAYERLRTTSVLAQQHQRLVQRTVDLMAEQSSSPSEAWSHCPQRGFLVEVQRRLNQYTCSTADRQMEGVVGEKGPLRSRVSGGRFGVQSVPAKLPWTMQNTPLR